MVTGLELFQDPANEVAANDDGAVTAAPRNARLVVVSGAKGGVGKSLIASNLAIYLATVGRRVVLVDADPVGANVHSYLGMPYGGAEMPGIDPVAAAAPAFVVRDAQIDGLGIVHAGFDEPLLGAPRTTPTRMLRDQARTFDADFVVVDAGSGLRGERLALWLDADLSLFITSPEPVAMENTYRFVRRAFAKSLLRSIPDAGQRKHMLACLRSLGNTPAPTDLIRRLDATGDPMADAVRDAVASFRFAFILNQTRTRDDLELGEAMRTATQRRLGLAVDYLGYIDQDDAVWACARSARPLLIESPGSKAGKSVEKLARRIMAAALGKGRERPARVVPAESHHDLLEVGRSASDEEVRRAYKRAKEVFADGSMACYGLFDGAALRVARARIDEAYDVLLDPARRRPYEISIFPPAPTQAEEMGHGVSMDDPPPPAPLITPETDIGGPLLRAVRESQGISLADIAKRTKVGVHYLESIETEDFAKLPAPVYVRGFVTELAKCLHLDASQVSRTYLRRYRRYIQEQEQAAR